MGIKVIGTQATQQKISTTVAHVAEVIEIEQKALIYGNKNMQVEPPCCIFIPSEYMMRQIITALAYMANVESKEMKLRFGL